MRAAALLAPARCCRELRHRLFRLDDLLSIPSLHCPFLAGRFYTVLMSWTVTDFYNLVSYPAFYSRRRHHSNHPETNRRLDLGARPRRRQKDTNLCSNLGLSRVHLHSNLLAVEVLQNIFL